MKKADIYMLLAGATWGFVGLLLQLLMGAGFSRWGAACVRIGIACIGMLVICFVRGKRFPALRARDYLFCAGAGILGFAFFNFAYFSAISTAGLAMAASLLYTSPAIVVILSRIFYKEPITKVKVVALLVTVLGSLLATGAVEAPEGVSLAGVGMGLLAAFGYSLYNLFSKAPLSRNSPENVTFYTLLFAGVAVFVIEPPTRWIGLLNSPYIVVAALAMGLVTCMLPSLLFSKGLSKMDSGRASILSSLELVVAAIIGFAGGEAVSVGKVAGILLLLSAILILNWPAKKAATVGAGEM